MFITTNTKGYKGSLWMSLSLSTTPFQWMSEGWEWSKCSYMFVDDPHKSTDKVAYTQAHEVVGQI